MKQKRTFVTLLLVIALLCLGIGYAAISDLDLTISGNISAIAAEGKVEVEFTDAEVQAGSKGTVTAEPFTTNAETSEKDYTKATINVSKLQAAGETATVIYTIENKADDIAATLADPTVSWDNTEWFNVTCTLSGKTLDKNSADITTDTQTATVVVTLLKTPVSEADQTAATDDITITINAAPVENKTPAETN